MHTVAILAYDGMSGFESGLAAEIFGMTELSARFSAGLKRPWYSVKLCAEADELRLLGGATVRTAYGLSDLADADTLVIPSVRDVEKPSAPASMASRTIVRMSAMSSGVAGSFLAPRCPMT